MEKNEYEYWRRRAESHQRKIVAVFALVVICIGGGLWLWSHPLKINRPTPSSNVEQELAFPKSGTTILYQQSVAPSAQFTVKTDKDASENCVIKLETWNTGIPAVELFVRARERGETNAVPLGDYRVKIACGIKWHGREELFGSATRVAIGQVPLSFSMSGNIINGQILDLTKQLAGNFHTNNSYFNRF